MIIGPGITIGSGIYVDSNVPSTGIVTGSLLFNLDMRNYTSGTTWPDSSGNNNNFQFFANPNDNISGTVYNLGTDTAYWYSPGNNGAIAADYIFPANINYSKGAVIWNAYGVFNNIIGSSGQETLWGYGGGPYLQAGNNGGNYGEVSSAPNAFPVGQWIYVSMDFDLSTGWTLYFNGTQVGTSSLTGARYDNSVPQIFSYSGNANQSEGKIAAALLYTRTLSPAEHVQNANYYATRYNGTNPT